RKNKIEKINRVIKYKIKNYASDDIISKLKKKGIPCANVNNLKQVLNSEKIIDRDLIVKWTQGEIGERLGINYPYKFKNTKTSLRSPAPTLGEHTHNIFKELGYYKKTIQDLKKANIIKTFHLQ